MSAKSLPWLRGPKEVPIDGLRHKNVAIIGYGNQGRAHALNLRDSGIHVVIGTRNQATALHDGFQVQSIALAASADVVIIALPDEVQGAVFESDIKAQLQPNATLGFLHGFSIHFEQVKPPKNIGVIMVAPKGPGVTVRQRYLDGTGVLSLIAVQTDNTDNTARSIALGWAAGIGSDRIGVLESSFADETETDLFGEQAVIVGGLTALIRASYEILVDAGYPKELAYIECCHEVKQVADILHERGICEMMAAISNTAEMGAYVAMDEIDDDHLRSHLRQLLANIKDGTFAKQLANGTIQSKRNALADHDIEQVGKEIRSLMQRGTD